MDFEYFAVMDGMGRMIGHLNHSGAARPDPVNLCKNVFHRLIKFAGWEKPGLSRPARLKNGVGEGRLCPGAGAERYAGVPGAVVPGISGYVCAKG